MTKQDKRRDKKNEEVVRPAKVVSGRKAGADRAGLDAAMEAGLPVGGYCPEERLAEDGRVPDHYRLVELTKGGYPFRTEKNVIESDGTLILNVGKVTGGTKFTLDCAKKQSKPFLLVQLDDEPKHDAVLRWIEMFDIKERSRPARIQVPRNVRSCQGFILDAKLLMVFTMAIQS